MDWVVCVCVWGMEAEKLWLYGWEGQQCWVRLFDGDVLRSSVSLGLESFVICSYVRAHVLVVIYQIIVPTDERCHDVTLRKQHLRWCKTFDLIFMFLVVCYGIQLCWSGNGYWCWEYLLLYTSSTDNKTSGSRSCNVALIRAESMPPFAPRNKQSHNYQEP